MGKQPRMLAPYSKRAVAVACHPKQEIIAVGFEDGLIMLVPHRRRRGDPREEAGRRADRRRSPGARTDAKLAFGTEDGEAGIADLA